MYNPRLIHALDQDRRRDAQLPRSMGATAGKSGPLIRARRGIGHGLILLGQWVAQGARATYI